MSRGLRVGAAGLKDPDDDYAFQKLVGDVARLKQELRVGSSLGAGGTTVGGDTENAVSIQGVPVTATAPTDGQTMTYSSTTGLWTPTTPGGGAPDKRLYATGSTTALAFLTATNVGTLFGTAVVDDWGGAWSAATGVFTATEAGIYTFNVGFALSVGGTVDAQNNISWVVNSANLSAVGLFAYGGSTASQSVSASVTLRLAVGGTVGLTATFISDTTRSISGNYLTAAQLS